MYRNGVHVNSAQTKIDSLTPANAALHIGGWSTDFFHGRVDEVRVEHVARRVAWIKLYYENQKPDKMLLSLE